MRRVAGSTLVELVVVLTLVSVLAGGMSTFLVAPLQGYADLNRRARLVDEAESALRRMARDVRRALPNSVRVAGGGTVLELLHTADGAKYRRETGAPHTSEDDRLRFDTSGDSRWNVLGRFEALSFTYGTALPAGTRVVVYPISTATVYGDGELGPSPGLMTPAGTTITLADQGNDEDQIQLSAPFRFRFESPEQRLYLVDGPVTYFCDVAAGTLTRYAGYAIRQVQPAVPTAAPLSTAASAGVARRVSSCQFLYQPGTSQRKAMLSLELTLAEAGEQIRLLHQIHVENAP